MSDDEARMTEAGGPPGDGVSSPRAQVDGLLEVVYDVCGDDDAAGARLLSFLDHIGFDVGAILCAQDLTQALPAFYRIAQGRYDLARLERDLVTWPPIADAIAERASALGLRMPVQPPAGDSAVPAKGPGPAPRPARRKSSPRPRGLSANANSRQMICDSARKIDIRPHRTHPPRNLMWRGRPVQVVSTPCNFGGERYWFLCPACARRCAILYPRLCRTCAGGRYRSEIASPSDRRLARAFALRRKLGWRNAGRGLAEPFPPKPLRMRWHTYLRLRATGTELEREIWAAAAKELGLDDA